MPDTDVPVVDQPRLANHCAALYARLDNEAKTADGTNDRIWEGKIIDTCVSLGISIGSYSRVVNALRTLGCVELLAQGTRAKPSAYRLHYPPTPEVWREHAPDRTEDLTSSPSYDTMVAELRDMRKQLGNVNVLEAFISVEEQLNELDKRVKELEEEKRLRTAEQAPSS